MFAVEVRDHIMIAHALHGALFGPAQRVHGATLVVDVAFMAEALDANGVVIDIGKAADTVKAAFAPLNYRNLDELPDFQNANTTVEFLTRYLFEQIAGMARSGSLGRDGRELAAMRITIAESHVARAGFGPIMNGEAAMGARLAALQL